MMSKGKGAAFIILLLVSWCLAASALQWPQMPALQIVQRSNIAPGSPQQTDVASVLNALRVAGPKPPAEEPRAEACPGNYTKPVPEKSGQVRMQYGGLLRRAAVMMWPDTLGLQVLCVPQVSCYFYVPAPHIFACLVPFLWCGVCALNEIRGFD